jgi:hypothetical protein
MLAFPHRVKYIKRDKKEERIFASDVRTRQLIDVTPERDNAKQTPRPRKTRIAQTSSSTRS